jgi:catechol 2,3-dioxygenase-like lactoylglutathione lyase family enzyme
MALEKTTFLHVGVTVSDLDRSADFYEKYFGFKTQFKKVFSAEFISRFKNLYKMEDGVFSRFAFLSSPDGVVLELFEFSRQAPFETPAWNRPGYHHICLKVGDVPAKYAEMKAGGVEFFFEPGFRGDPKNNQYWVFLRDPDGNMIELQ